MLSSYLVITMIEGDVEEKISLKEIKNELEQLENAIWGIVNGNYENLTKVSLVNINENLKKIILELREYEIKNKKDDDLIRIYSLIFLIIIHIEVLILKL